MSDFDNSLEKVKKISESVREQRRKEWEMIQRETPVFAEFLTQISKTFGKPEALAIRSEGRVIFKKGILLPERSVKHYVNRVATNNPKHAQIRPRNSRHQTKAKK